MTIEAREALEEAEIFCCYSVYIDLVREQYPGKQFYTTPMTQELERCRWAVEQAAQGKTVAMLCSGDAGVYGMAGPVIELAQQTEKIASPITGEAQQAEKMACPIIGEAHQTEKVEVIRVPGVTAALSGAAVLGAPLMNDFCVISLSDRLTPWEIIEKRLLAAAQGDFIICLYNPSSRERKEHLARACQILLQEKPSDTVCGWVRKIGRDGQEKRLLTLAQLQFENVDMFTTVFIGNRDTVRMGDCMVTKRGYTRDRRKP